jgi:tetratricopeptide (TPR) repeat protein
MIRPRWKLDPILTNAARLAGKKRYDGAARILSTEVNRYHGSFSYYYLFGVTCLYSGDFGGAKTYFDLARKAKMRDPLVLLGLAVLYLRLGKTNRAVEFYLEVQELDEKNRLAKKALGIIRRNAGAEKFSAWMDTGKLPGLYPPIPIPAASRKWLVIPVLILIFAAGTGLFLRVTASHRGGRPVEGAVLDRSDRESPVESGGSYRYILTRKEVLDTYEKGLSLFSAYRDEAARVHLNRILESNAAEAVKNKARLILSYTEVPGFDTFNRGDNPSYGTVIREPFLYRDVHVIWRGMATNMIVQGSRSSFDFLVGYDTRTTLEGIVPVTFDRAVAVNLEKPLEVLGRVVPVGGAEGPGIRLEGIAIHQSGLPENPATEGPTAPAP